MNMDYRLSKYVIKVELDEGMALYNTLNGALLFFNETEYIDEINKMYNSNNISFCRPELLKKLYDIYMIIDRNMNEVDLANLIFLNRYKENRTLKVLIYVTNDCNFNCVYCPQSHSKTYMKEETMESICTSIEELIKSGQYTSLSVSWFGGEPLLNIRVIEKGMTRFLEFSQKYRIDVWGGITTNGYLLTQENIDILFSLKVMEFQITLDGLEADHNKNRVLKSGCGTWQTIWNNLIHMEHRHEEFCVYLRMNTNLENISGVIELSDLVKATLDNRFHIKIQPIVNMGNTNPNAKYCSALESQILQLDLYQYMSEKNLEDKTIEYVIEPFGLMCNCSDPNYFVIKENGTICKCELNVEATNNVFGEIKDNNFRIDLSKMTSYLVPSTSKECIECNLYPMCFGLTCPYKRKEGRACDLRQSFLIEEYIKSVAVKLMKQTKALGANGGTV